MTTNEIVHYVLMALVTGVVIFGMILFTLATNDEVGDDNKPTQKKKAQ